MKIGLGIGLGYSKESGGAIPPAISSVTISGTAVVGQTLTATASGVTGIPTPTLSYQWKRGATNIGTNSSTYTLVSADAGQSITCVVTGTNTGGSVNVTSNALSILATLLDIYPSASAAYSLRLLRGAFYTSNAIRVRRSSDNTEQDIGFTTSGNLNTTALTSFVGANNGFIVTWYDQSGNGNNATQATQANQPQIVSAGSVLMQGANPTAVFNGSSNFMDATGVTSGNPKSIFVSTKNNYIGSLEKVLFDSITTNQAILYKAPSNNIGVGFGTFSATSYTSTTNFILYSVLHNGATSNMYVNSSSQVLTNQNLGTNAFSGLRIGAGRGTAALHYQGNISEFIVYPSNQASDKVQIESNINNYYTIYPVVSDPDAQVFVSAAELTSQTQADAVNTLVIGMKAQGLWTKMKAVYPMVGGTASAHKFNLKDPRDLDVAFRLAFSGTITHSANGIQGNAVNGFANTFLNTATTLSRDSNHISYYSRTSSTATVSVEMGVSNAVTVFMHLRSAVNYLSGTLNIANFTTTGTAAGYWLGSKVSSTSRKAYRNGILEGTNTTLDITANLSANLFLLARNDSGTAAVFSDKQCAFASIGDGLSDAEASTFYNLVQTLQTTLGRQV